jgi:hypothetical protein
MLLIGCFESAAWLHCNCSNIFMVQPMLIKFVTEPTYYVLDTYLIRIHVRFASDTLVNVSRRFNMCWLADSVNNSLDSPFRQVSQLCRCIYGLYLRSHTRCRIDWSTDDPMNSVEKSSIFQRGGDSNCPSVLILMGYNCTNMWFLPLSIFSYIYLLLNTFAFIFFY